MKENENKINFLHMISVRPISVGYEFLRYIKLLSLSILIESPMIRPKSHNVISLILILLETYQVDVKNGKNK